MEVSTTTDFRHLPGRHEQEDAAEKLRLESSQLFGHPPLQNDATANGAATFNNVQKEKNAVSPSPQGDTYTIKSGDNLSSIAQRMLRLRGETSSPQKVYEEVNRIIELNRDKHPLLSEHPNKIRPGMQLQVWDKETGPDPTCKWRDWKSAQPGQITVALKCESIFAGKDTQVIVTPGARAVFTPGSSGFLAPKALALTLPGSRVTAVGGEIINEGGDLQVLHPETIVQNKKQ